MYAVYMHPFDHAESLRVVISEEKCTSETKQSKTKPCTLLSADSMRNPLGEFP
jgi:hypothetical protein